MSAIVLVGSQPNESIEFCLKMLKQTSPFSFMFGCQIFVLQCTLGGFKQKKLATLY
jgi:hypothetical protein